jgi:hypothetical protein
MRQEPFLQCFKEGGQGTSPPSFNQLTSQQDAQGHNRYVSAWRLYSFSGERNEALFKVK